MAPAQQRLRRFAFSLRVTTCCTARFRLVFQLILSHWATRGGLDSTREILSLVSVLQRCSFISGWRHYLERQLNGGIMKRDLVTGLAWGVMGTFGFVVPAIILVSLDATPFD
jgi:hypothetical protein